jgi:hypothetical protein
MKRKKVFAIRQLLLGLFCVLTVYIPFVPGADLTKLYQKNVPIKAKVFYNKNGLKDEIKIEDPLRELNAISKTKSESFEELVEHVSVWIPKYYMELFQVKPMCIIILGKKINDEKRAEIRFGVAMKCSKKYSLSETIEI